LSVVGVDVGGTKIAAALVGADGAILGARRTPTPPDGDALLSEVGRVVRELATAAPTPPIAVGLGIASLLNHQGHALWSTHLDLADRSPAHELAALVNLPVAVDNDANVAALAEARMGAARGYRSAIMMTLGTGIGGGVIIDGMIFHGGRGYGGELGHLVVDAGGPPCQGGCPSNGCIEAMASGTAVSREARAAAAADPRGALAVAQLDRGALTAEDVVSIARTGDAAAVAILARAGRYLGVALASIANVVSPDIAVIGGGMGSAVGDLMLAPARDEYRRRVLPPGADMPIVTATLGPDAGVLGAAMLATEIAA
jgi:glucokinase